MPAEESQKKKTIDPGVKGQLRGTMYSALAYLSEIEAYEPNKMLLEQITEEDRDALTVQWLADRVDSLARFAVGAQAFDFNYVDPDGNMVRLSDFRGKLVLIDFWASWCGPCRAEMQNLKKLYKGYEGKPIEFISVSLDKSGKDWRQANTEEQIPWPSLWMNESFNAQIAKQLGIEAIPFIVVVNKEGKIVGKNLRDRALIDKINEALK